MGDEVTKNVSLTFRSTIDRFFCSFRFGNGNESQEVKLIKGN